MDGEPDEPTDGLGIEEDQGCRDPFHEREIVAGHDLANQGNAVVLTDRGRVLRADREDLQPGPDLVVHAPAQERLDDAADDGVLGEPGVEVGLGALADDAVPFGEPGKEGGCLDELGAGGFDGPGAEGPLGGGGPELALTVSDRCLRS